MTISGQGGRTGHGSEVLTLRPLSQPSPRCPVKVKFLWKTPTDASRPAEFYLLLWPRAMPRSGHAGSFDQKIKIRRGFTLLAMENQVHL